VPSVVKHFYLLVKTKEINHRGHRALRFTEKGKRDVKIKVKVKDLKSVTILCQKISSVFSSIFDFFLFLCALSGETIFIFSLS